jgi:putative heme transporter
VSGPSRLRHWPRIGGMPRLPRWPHRLPPAWRREGVADDEPVAAPPPAVRPPRVRGDGETVPWAMRAAAAWGWRFLVLAAVVYVILIPIARALFVVYAVIAALLISALLSSTVVALRRLGLPRALATLIVFVGGISGLVAMGWFITQQFATSYDSLEDNVTDGIRQVRVWLNEGPLDLTDAQVENYVDNLLATLRNNQGGIASGALNVTAAAIEVVGGIFLALFLTFFFLYDGQRIWRWVVGLFPTAVAYDVWQAGRRAWTTLTGYVRGTMVVAFVDAVFIGLAVALVGVPLAVPIGALVFLGAFVPLVGATVTGAVAVLVALVAQGLGPALIVLGSVILVQQLEGHILQPFVLGRAVRLHPVAVALAVTTGGILAGIGGAIIAVPLVAVVNTVAVYLVRERPARLASNDPAVPDPDRFVPHAGVLASDAPPAVPSPAPDSGAGNHDQAPRSAQGDTAQPPDAAG